MVGQKLIDLENKLDRQLCIKDITTKSCGFSYGLVKKYFGNLSNAKIELKLIRR